MPSPQTKKQSLFRFFLPLILCGLFVLGLIGYRQHKIWSERTHVKFAIRLEDKSVDSEAAVLLDGQRVVSGDRVAIGSHRLIVTHPKAERFETNFFAWYGGSDFGQFNLHRSVGHLKVQSTTPVARLSIIGHDFSTELKEVPASALEVPTDSYKIVATYPHWSLIKAVVVGDGATAACSFEPQFGALAFTCNFENAIFRILDPDNKIVESGLVPATVTGLPVGVYQLIVTSRGHELKKDVTIALNQTNAATADFVFGTVLIETSPRGVTVVDENGKVLGQSPMTLNELGPGQRNFNLQKAGFESVQITMNIEANRTNSIRTNLVNRVYVAAMEQARQYLASTNFAKTLIAVQQALDANSGDSDALALQRETRGQQAVQLAKLEGARKNYTDALNFLETALQSKPDDEGVKNLLADYKQRASAQAEQAKAEKLNQLQNEFDAWMAQDPDFNLFETRELKTTKSSPAVAAAIRDTFVNEIHFKLTRDDSPKPGLYAIDAQQEIMTYMNTSGGRRRCVIMVGPTKDDEIKILFKIIEYKTEAVNKFSIGNAIGAPVAVNYVPLDSSKELLDKEQKIQIAGGIHFVTERLQKAISQP